jgi:hypothetical protein
VWFAELVLQSLPAIPETAAQDGHVIRRLLTAAF